MAASSPPPLENELLRDEDFAELSLEPAAVDRLMGGKCLVEQLSASQGRKRRRAPTLDQDVELQDPAAAEPEAEPLCCLSDVEDSDEDATDADDDDGADALIAAFGPAQDQNQNQDHQQRCTAGRRCRARRRPRPCACVTAAA